MAIRRYKGLATISLYLFISLATEVGFSQTSGRSAGISLEVGRHHVALGSDIKTVVEDISKEFSIRYIDGTHPFWVVSKSPDSDPIAYLTASGPRVVGVQHLIGEQSARTEDELFGLLLQVTSQMSGSASACKPDSFHNDSDIATITGVTLNCGSRRFRFVRDEVGRSGERKSLFFEAWEDIGLENFGSR